MAVRQTGWSMLSSHSVQEAQDLALVAHLATLAGSVPVVHFFDGFRTSHEINKASGACQGWGAGIMHPPGVGCKQTGRPCGPAPQNTCAHGATCLQSAPAQRQSPGAAPQIELIDNEAIKPLMDELAPAIAAHHARALNPSHPHQRGTAQGPDVYMQSIEAANPFHKVQLWAGLCSILFQNRLPALAKQAQGGALPVQGIHPTSSPRHPPRCLPASPAGHARHCAGRHGQGGRRHRPPVPPV